MRSKVSGIVPIVAIPFSDDGLIDQKSFHSLMEHLLQSGASGLMLFGIASEFYKLSESEKETVQRIFLKYTCTSDVYGIVSITDHSWEVAARNAAIAEAEGADTINIFPPHFLHPSREAVREHIEKIAKAVRIPIMVQYAPRETGKELDPMFFATLQQSYPHLATVKVETQPPGPYIGELLRRSPTLQSMVGYAGINMMDALDRGAVGIQPGCSFTEIYVKLLNYYKLNDREAASRLYQRLLPYLSLWMQHPEYIIKVEKEILWKRGYIKTPYCRASSYPLDDHDYDNINQFFAEFTRELAGQVANP